MANELNLTVPAIVATVNPLDVFKSQVVKGSAALKALPPITSKATLELNVETLKKGNILIGLVEKAADQLCAPLRETKKQIDEVQKKIKGYASDMNAPIIEAVDAIQKAILFYQKEEAKRAAAATLKAAIIEEEMAAKGIVASSSPVIQPEKVKGLRTIWKAEITDATLVPREYCSPSTVLINEAVRAGIREIPGVKIYSDQKIV